MSLSVRSKPYIIPEYSLTGDLLSYLTCGLQYRYQNKGSLPPSKPVQLWFGEFIHGVMEEAYREWQQNPQKRRFPWNWNSEIRDIELRIHRRLSARGLNPPPGQFCRYDSPSNTQRLCPDAKHPHKLLASKRTEAAINTWGKHLFPLINEAEVKLKGIRDMPSYNPRVSRSNYYGITGIIDVISSVHLANAPSGNLILHEIHQNSQIQQVIDNLTSPEYEIIIDYKGMRRPSNLADKWNYHEWQILTYAGLRKQQPQSKPIVAGILFYLNELIPSKTDIKLLKPEVVNNETDIMPSGLDLRNIINWIPRPRTDAPVLTLPFRESRSIRVIPILPSNIQNGFQNFDNVVDEIESSILSETSGQLINSCWRAMAHRETCTACDFKTFCRSSAQRGAPTVP
ncbi:PD-(D/E)XK nuclease superfamily protein [uncultured archaeon]|nr:PD-(D/E)XK nuclease superfamily protein [uncultured archaeon]